MNSNSPPKPYNEEYRQTVVEDLAILDSPPEPGFDRVARLTQRHFGVQIALISLFDRDRQWFKAACGLEASESSRDVAFCAHTITQSDVLVVLDTKRDKRFADNPFVTEAPYIRFYAGAPLIVDQAAIGTLCIVDDRPRDGFSEEERECLHAFARIVEDEIELRRRSREAMAQLSENLDEARQLAEAGKIAKAQFLALVSHELRTPLNAVIGFADCIAEELVGPIENPEYKEFARKIAASGKRQLGLVDRLLVLSDQGRVEIEDDTVDMLALARSCIDMLSGELLIAGVSLDFVAPADAVLVTADPTHLRHMLLELVGNAAKFTPRGGRVRLSYGLDETGRLVIEIADSGDGITPEALDEALSVFGQLSAGWDRAHEGAGLGLPIVKRLAELHGGTLSLSTTETGGTLASLRFPAYRVLDEQPPSSQAEQTAG